MTLIEQLRLTRLAPDVFEGSAPSWSERRVFGGGVVAQGLLAAYETVPDQLCHSLHACFILAGDPRLPIRYEVASLRDGTSFCTRRVSALQDRRCIFELTASFQRPEAGFEHQIDGANLRPGPDELGDDDVRGASAGILLRNVGLPRPGFEPVARPPRHRMWFRSAAPLGAEPRFHQAALAYASDFPQIPTIVQPHEVTWKTPGLQFASLDHALWFHRPFDFGRWHLCDMDTPVSSDGRGLSRGLIYDEDGVLVASVVQEAMLRMRPRPP